MPIYKSTFFKRSELAYQLLSGLKGLEVGGSRHNQWELDIVNVDKFGADDPRGQIYRDEQVRLCGEYLPVDIVAPGDKIPVADKSFDFVIASHVIEHFFDPIAALKEWARIARKYIYIVCPQPDALESDRGKLITPLDTLFARHRGEIPYSDSDEHHTRWTSGTFLDMCAALGFYVNPAHVEDPDKKVGNGFVIVIDLEPHSENLIKVGETLQRIEQKLPIKKRKK